MADHTDVSKSIEKLSKAVENLMKLPPSKKKGLFYGFFTNNSISTPQQNAINKMEELICSVVRIIERNNIEGVCIEFSSNESFHNAGDVFIEALNNGMLETSDPWNYISQIKDRIVPPINRWEKWYEKNSMTINQYVPYSNGVVYVYNYLVDIKTTVNGFYYKERKKRKKRFGEKLLIAMISAIIGYCINPLIDHFTIEPVKENETLQLNPPSTIDTTASATTIDSMVYNLTPDEILTIDHKKLITKQQ